jgi:hypothetical protein
MCMMLYLAADAPVFEIAPTEPPGEFSVTMIDGDDVLVCAVFSKPAVYRCGSYTGCSCGFSYGSNDAEGLPGQGSLRALYDFIGGALTPTTTLEMYSCWSGDEGNPPETRQRVSLAELMESGGTFDFTERTLVTVAP